LIDINLVIDHKKEKINGTRIYSITYYIYPIKSKRILILCETIPLSICDHSFFDFASFGFIILKLLQKNIISSLATIVTEHHNDNAAPAHT
jgi:hypothetical protein